MPPWRLWAQPRGKVQVSRASPEGDGGGGTSPAMPGGAGEDDMLVGTSSGGAVDGASLATRKWVTSSRRQPAASRSTTVTLSAPSWRILAVINPLATQDRVGFFKKFGAAPLDGPLGHRAGQPGRESSPDKSTKPGPFYPDRPAETSGVRT